MRTNSRPARRFGFRFLAGVFLLVAMVLGAETPPPVTYQGRTVNDWLLRAASKADGDRQSAEAAFRAMGAMAVPDLLYAMNGARPPAAAPPMLEGLRITAVEMLGKLGPLAASAIPQLAAAMEDPGPMVLDVASALGSIGPPALPQLMVALRSPRSWVRVQAARVLGGDAFRPRIDEVLPALIAATGDPIPDVRKSALRSLDALKDPRASPTLAAALQDEDATVRELAVEALLKLGPAAASAAGAMRESLAHPRASGPFSTDRSSIRLAAALWHATGDANTALLLEQSLRGPDRRIAATVLGEIGPPAALFIPALSSCLEAQIVDEVPGKPESVERADLETIAKAMVRIGSPPVSPLVALLGDSRPGVRQRVAIALGCLGTNAAPAVPALVKALDDANGTAQIAAVEALGAIGPAASLALPRLRRVVDQSTNGTDFADLLQITAEIAMDAISSGARPAVASAPSVTAH
ncbi:MAG: HEAT repeat domain-containing protein [Verrucomicrobiota bacterium]